MSEDLEKIFQALTSNGYPEADPEPFIRRQTRKERLTFNTWRRPFPYILHGYTVTDDRENYLGSGTKRTVSKFVNDWDRIACDEWYGLPGSEYNPNPAPSYKAVPWLVHTNCDKMHRCPVCCTSGGWLDQVEHGMKRWRIYTCDRCGQRASKRFYLREHPCDRCRMFMHLRWVPRHALMTLHWWYWKIPVEVRRVPRNAWRAVYWRYLDWRYGPEGEDNGQS